MTITRNVQIPIAEHTNVDGRLSIPPNPIGLVIFAHGSGSTHRSVRNQRVAEMLHSADFATLLFDLLTEKESISTENRFDIDLLTDRLRNATNWAIAQRETAGLPIAYFGASTGAAAALRAAVGRDDIFALVSRGGRPDLISESELCRITTPTLLIVGAQDTDVLERTVPAYDMLGCKKKLIVVPGASHLFEEPGALDDVAIRATEWFSAHSPITAA